MNCTYRPVKCKLPNRRGIYEECELCLIGQLCDEVGLVSSAIMEISLKQLMDNADSLAKKYPDTAKAIDEALEE